MVLLKAQRLERYILAVWIAIAFAYVAVYARNSVLQADFVPFYCAGAVLNQHENPYLAVPLGRCEAPFLGVAVIPAPLPPYALGVFRLVSLLPYEMAAELWRCIVLAATAATIVALRALVRLPYAMLCAAILPIALRDTIPLGQPFPIILAALVLAALAIERGHDFVAALWLSVTMIEPNVGMPACCAVFLFRPASRLGLILGALVAIIITVIVVPSSLTGMYFGEVIRAQAESEVGWFMQYSLTHVLFLAGIAPQTAVAVGGISYVAMFLLGVSMAHRLAARTTPSMLALLPPSVAVLGGSYVHIWQVQIALLATLTFLATSGGEGRRIAVLATLMLSVPWMEIGFPATAVLSVMSIATMVTVLCRDHYFALAASAVVALAAWKVSSIQPQMQAVSTPLRHLQPNALAQVAWAEYAERAGPLHQDIALLLKVPTWAGLVVLMLFAVNHRCVQNRAGT